VCRRRAVPEGSLASGGSSNLRYSFLDETRGLRLVEASGSLKMELERTRQKRATLKRELQSSLESFGFGPSKRPLPQRQGLALKMLAWTKTLEVVE